MSTNKDLKEGFTTGTCAAAAAKAAVVFMAEGRSLDKVEIALPDGKTVELDIERVEHENGGAAASVRKDAGDDPDVTDGVLVKASVYRRGGEGVAFEAGDGVGTVTKKGLSVPPGEAAINPVPRQMIEKAVREITHEPLTIAVSIDGGAKLAAKTFNPRLGIVGGLSVLGTTGIVRPYSHPAIKESLKCLLDVALATGIESPVFTAGNIGTRAAINYLGIPKERVIEVGNEWGFMIDHAAKRKISGLLALGHPGKLAKLAAGDWDTHSSRSKSAVPYVLDISKKLKIKKTVEDAATVEGIFESLSRDEGKLLASELSKRIYTAISERIENRFEVCVALVNMKGELTGFFGNLKRWQN